MECSVSVLTSYFHTVKITFNELIWVLTLTDCLVLAFWTDVFPPKNFSKFSLIIQYHECEEKLPLGSNSSILKVMCQVHNKNLQLFEKLDSYHGGLLWPGAGLEEPLGLSHVCCMFRPDPAFPPHCCQSQSVSLLSSVITHSSHSSCSLKQHCSVFIQQLPCTVR